MKAATLLAVALAALAARDGASLTPFSAAAPGAAIPAAWHAAIPPRTAPPQFALVDDAGETVLRVHSQAAAGALTHALRVDANARPVLTWRWKVDHVVAKADFETKEGDDFAARVYVFFDLPTSELTFGERAVLALGRLLHGEALPSAGICYVWDNRHARGSSEWNPYWRRVRTVVLESGDALAGSWVGERRDLRADFIAAFGTRGGKRLPAVVGVAVGNDTDQTRESATAWFGDLTIEAAR